LDEVGLDELAEALDRAAAKRHAQASPDLTTLESEVSTSLERLEWRRRESNPRPQQGGFGGEPCPRGSWALGYSKENRAGSASSLAFREGSRFARVQSPPLATLTTAPRARLTIS
jgi:hypothetical protein